MRTEAEAERRLRFAIDVEHVGVFEGVFVAVGGADNALHHRPLRDRYIADLQVFGGLAHLEGGHGLEAHRFIDGLVHQAAVIAHPLQHLGVLQQ
ncbi:hypothetical protein D9M71_807050 [compost metagenome]